MEDMRYDIIPKLVVQGYLGQQQRGLTLVLASEKVNT
jgi:hypothetical protein